MLANVVKPATAPGTSVQADRESSNMLNNGCCGIKGGKMMSLAVTAIARDAMPMKPMLYILWILEWTMLGYSKLSHVWPSFWLLISGRHPRIPARIKAKCSRADSGIDMISPAIVESLLL
jgi:hypothetical protein